MGESNSIRSKSHDVHSTILRSSSANRLPMGGTGHTECPSPSDIVVRASVANTISADSDDKYSIALAPRRVVGFFRSRFHVATRMMNDFLYRSVRMSSRFSAARASSR